MDWYEPLLWWWAQLQWPTEEKEDDKGITWIELYVSFVHSTRVEMTEPRRGAAQNTLWAQAARFADASRRLGRIHKKMPWPGRVIKECRALSGFGCARAAGLDIRPKVPSHQQMERQIATWLDDKIKQGTNLSKGNGLWRWAGKYSHRGVQHRWQETKQRLKKANPRKRLTRKQPERQRQEPRRRLRWKQPAGERRQQQIQTCTVHLDGELEN